MPCRIGRRFVWATRIQLEAACHRSSMFVTLTYAPEHLPPGGSLSDSHWREFTKGIGYRYFGCGEYGDRTENPHYHAVLFGISYQEVVDLVATRWPYGFSLVKFFAPEHAGYVAGYVVKKMTSKDDSRLQGRSPEFARMSRRPAIGTAFLPVLAARQTREDIVANLDVTSSVRIDGKLCPVGPTLHKKLRAMVTPLLDVEVAWRRQDRSMDWAYQVASDPILSADREVKRVTQVERAEALAKVRKRQL